MTTTELIKRYRNMHDENSGAAKALEEAERAER